MKLEKTMAYQEAMRSLRCFFNEMCILRMKVESGDYNDAIEADEKISLLKTLRVIVNKSRNMSELSPEKRLDLHKEMKAYHGLSIHEMAELTWLEPIEGNKKGSDSIESTL